MQNKKLDEIKIKTKMNLDPFVLYLWDLKNKKEVKKIIIWI